MYLSNQASIKHLRSNQASDKHTTPNQASKRADLKHGACLLVDTTGYVRHCVKRMESLIAGLTQECAILQS